MTRDEFLPFLLKTSLCALYLFLLLFSRGAFLFAEEPALGLETAVAETEKERGESGAMEEKSPLLSEAAVAEEEDVIELPLQPTRQASFWIKPKVKVESQFYLTGVNVAKKKHLGFWGEAQMEMGADYNHWTGILLTLKAREFDQMKEAKEGFFIDDLHIWLKPLQLFGLTPSFLDLLLKTGLTNVSGGTARHASFDDWKASVHDLDKNARGKGLVPTVQLDLILYQFLTLRLGSRLADYSDGGADGVLAHDLLLSLLFEKTFDPHKIQASISWVGDLSNETKGVGKNNQDFDELGLAVAYTLNLPTVELTPFFNLLLRTVFTGESENSYGQEQMGAKWSGGLMFSYRVDNLTWLFVGLDLGGEWRWGIEKYDGDYQAFQNLGLTLSSDILKKFMGERFISIWTKVHLAVDEPYRAGVGRFARISPLEKFELGVNQRLLVENDFYIGLLLIYELTNSNQYYDTVTKNYVDNKGANPNVGLNHNIKIQLEMNFKNTWSKKF